MAWSIFDQGQGDQLAVGWAQQFLTLIGAPVTPGNVQFIYDWEKSEGGGGKFNPLNTGPVSQHPEWTTTGEQFGGGAADYASWQAGQLGSAYYLQHYQPQGYGPILRALQNNDPASARAALIASPWAASHYDNGRSFSNDATPGGTPVLPPLANSGGSNGLSQLASDTGTNTTSDNTCAVPLPLGTCLLSKSSVRGLLGAVLIGTAVLIGVVGAIILVANGLQNTSAGKAAQGAASSLIPAGRALNVVRPK